MICYIIYVLQMPTNVLELVCCALEIWKLTVCAKNFKQFARTDERIYKSVKNFMNWFLFNCESYNLAIFGNLGANSGYIDTVEIGCTFFFWVSEPIILLFY